MAPTGAAGTLAAPIHHQDIVQAAPLLLPVLRHQNDLGVVVTAVQARPDFVISANTAHWNAALAARTDLRIMSPNAFLASLTPLLPDA